MKLFRPASLSNDARGILSAHASLPQNDISETSFSLFFFPFSPKRDTFVFWTWLCMPWEKQFCYYVQLEFEWRSPWEVNDRFFMLGLRGLQNLFCNTKDWKAFLSGIIQSQPTMSFSCARFSMSNLPSLLPRSTQDTEQSNPSAVCLPWSSPVDKVFSAP